jgi:toxin-antitoxin system PIN domain toxin
VIAVDTNLLVYAHREDSPWHAEALKMVRGLAEGSTRWAIPRPCVHEFLAIVTHPRIFRPPTPLAVAIQAMAAWKLSPMLSFLGESEDHLESLAFVATAAKAEGARIHDARIAAICLSHGVKELWSADRDFSRFPKLKVKNPLV